MGGGTGGHTHTKQQLTVLLRSTKLNNIEEGAGRFFLSFDEEE
jgi:hypothetical protein